MWQKELTGLLKDEIDYHLDNLNEVSSLYSLVREPLEQKRRGLSPDNEDCLWALLPVVVCEAICGDGTRALPAAASLQFLLAAGDVFDDIQDADSPDSIYARYGLAAAVSAASTLLILGERSLTHLKSRGVDGDTIVRIIDRITSLYTSACIGQHLDLNVDLTIPGSEEFYLKIVSMKSATQIECACYTGALIAGANQEVIDKFASFGHNLGMAFQISNDIQGIISDRDIIRRKITLPVIFGLNESEEAIRYELKTKYQKQASNAPATEAIKNLLFQTGAMQYTIIKMDVYKQKAMDILTNLNLAGINVVKLQPFFKGADK